MFSLNWFDDCSFLFLYTYFNSDSISKIWTSPVATVSIGELSPSKLDMKHYNSVKVLSNFQFFNPLRKF